MASDQPFAGFSDLMTQGFEQSRKAMEKYAELFEKGMKASPLLDADLNKKVKDYSTRILSLRTSTYGSYPKPRMSNPSGRFRPISCRRNGRRSVNR